MTGLGTSIKVVIGTAVVAGALTFALPIDESLRVSARYGIALSTVFGGLALVMKSQLRLVRALPQHAQVKALLLTQGLSFGLRVLAVLFGTWVCARNELSPLAFVVGFFSTYLVQQAVEVRHLLAVSTVQPEVKS